MPIKTLYDNESGLVQTTCSGKISYTDLSNYQKSVWLEPDVTGFNEIIDFSEADLSEISFSDLISLAENTPKVFALSLHSKLALITKTDHQKQLIEFYISVNTLAETPARSIKNFDSLNNALSWLSEN